MPSPDPETIVHQAFALLHKPEVDDENDLTKPPIGFSAPLDYDGLLEKINFLLMEAGVPKPRWLSNNDAKAWQTPKPPATSCTVATVVASVKAALS